ncbi:HEAT repeat protein [Metarhizium album ARSEF 1941]|uniref:HEAT repeat protein n=1 Tax=Metarhizium album (strain ARSEF 1941) TaxID=1081103 RepID=A0A0B2WGJ7_METAS|nr:HEAT repeat protein [Metarhizium album ARSEF 1941]KHN95126.1 HEAT repeat protein [Metarhizium album ARSEF 1941]
MVNPELPAEVTDLLASPVELIKWLEQQDAELGRRYAILLFEQLLQDAAQPKSVSGQACLRLCGLVEQSSGSKSDSLRIWAFSQDVTLKLFNFYIEWNESDTHRSMKLVLDLVARCILKSPDRDAALETKRHILDNLVSIVIGRSTKPVAKSAIKTLDHFLSKGVFNLCDIRPAYVAYRTDLQTQNEVKVWRTLTAELFHWMRLQFVRPTAGKLIVSLYRLWRQRSDAGATLSIETWHQWLLDFLAEEPTLLDSIKNYIFLPLFKADRTEALAFLGRMNEDQAVSGASGMSLDVPALLQLAALETGKKVGLVEEPALGGSNDHAEHKSSITLHETVLESVLAHPSHEVRCLALSLLVTSPSTTRPYSPVAFDLLRRYLGAFFADPDAKFRVDVASKTRDMFRRVRGAIHVLKRSIPRARAKAQKADAPLPFGKDAASQPMLYQSNLISLPEVQLTNCLGYHVEFLHWYLGFLCQELSPTASYQRHIAALKAFMYIIRLEGHASKNWETADDQELFFNCLDAKWARALFDLVMNPFEDVRDLSATALARCYADGRYRRLTLTGLETTKVPVQEVAELSQRASELARRTARADHSDGASKSSQLLYRFLGSDDERIRLLAAMASELKRKVSMAEEDLGQAVVDAPLHGDFASLCHTWQVVSDTKLSEYELRETNNIQLDIVSCCERAWGAVQDVLCDDSPEGHLPQELEEVDGLDTKDLLSYSFRAVHESSNLMRTIILSIRNRSRDGLIVPSKEVFEQIGNLTFRQLASLRHRGAFTTVSATFATCCQQTKYLQLEEDEKPLLDSWYEGTLDAIYSQASTTRRSAGIPSIITGILAANAPRPSFAQVMDTLMAIAAKEAKVSQADGSKLPQVHAYNCLKDIFKNSLITAQGNKSESYLPQCLELAASGLRSGVWAIRNCGLIFLRSLIDNLFGTHESKAVIEAGWDGKANRIHYHRYPNLPGVLKNLLQSGRRILSEPSASGTVAAESVFPALDIIRRAGPPDLLRDEIQVDVAAYLSSPVWHVRDMAARTLCSCLLHEKWLAVIRGIFDAAMASESRNKPNHVHGIFLTLKFVTERLNEVAHERLLADLPELRSFLIRTKVDTLFPDCPDITATYLEVVNMIWFLEATSRHPLSSFSITMPRMRGSVLLKIQKAIYDVCALSTLDDPMSQLQSLLQSREIGLGGLVAALETIPKVWDPSSCSQDTLASLSLLYVNVCLETNHSEAQVLALESLADIIDKLLKNKGSNKIPKAALVNLWLSLPARPMSPALSNAAIRASGSITAALIHPEKSTPISIHSWGRIMADAALDNKTFDTRFAAASSLASFFAASRPRGPEFLPALLALYDLLNDDDDEVRDMASLAANSVIGAALVPIEAANRLLQRLTKQFGAAPEFRAIVADRLVGYFGVQATKLESWEPAAVELARALEFDDSLFVVEEHNLFIDEVRETQRWAEVFETLEWDEKDEHLGKLVRWVEEGVAHVGKLADLEDGPLGWASNPAVFAICHRLIRCSVALGRKVERAELEHAVASAKGALRSSSTRVSKLLTEAWTDMHI